MKNKYYVVAIPFEKRWEALELLKYIQDHTSFPGSVLEIAPDEHGELNPQRILSLKDHGRS